MSQQRQDLIERWILAFCEAPPLIDEELMSRLLDEHEANEQEMAA